MEAWTIVTRIAERQLGLVARRQLRANGVGAPEVRDLVEAGRLVVLGPQALRVVGAPGGHDQVLLAGLLDLGPTGVVAGRAAGRVLGLDGCAAARPEFTMPRASRRPHPRWTVHGTRHLPRIDTVTVGSIRCTSAARTIIDLAGACSTDQLEALIGSALREGWTSEGFVRRRLLELRDRGRAGVRALDVVLDGRPFGHTYLERSFLHLVEAAGLPAPTTQVTLRARGTIVARVDALWREHMLVVEVHGARPHAPAAQQQRDAQRTTELQLLGHAVFTFTYADVVTRPDWVVHRLVEIFGLLEDRAG